MQLVFATSVCAVACLLASCVPQTTDDANRWSAGLGILRPVSNQSKSNILAYVGPQALFVPTVTQAKNYCEGSAGSNAAPLGVEGCAGEKFMAPFVFLQTFGQETTTQKMWDTFKQYPDQEALFVKQSVTESDCWAAVLEMARRVRKYSSLSKDDIKTTIGGQCPSVKSRKAADTYEIMFAIYYLQQTYHDQNVGNYLCNTGDCIVNAFLRGHAVIMLRNNHAVLVSGVKYHVVSGRKFLNALDILDPLSQSHAPAELGVSEFCTADAFVVY
jgi:hypothetical protein